MMQTCIEELSQMENNIQYLIKIATSFWEVTHDMLTLDRPITEQVDKVNSFPILEYEWFPCTWLFPCLYLRGEVGGMEWAALHQKLLNN